MPRMAGYVLKSSRLRKWARLILSAACVLGAHGFRLSLGESSPPGDDAATATDPPAKLDPTAWGGDHVGKPIPDPYTPSP